MQNDREWRVTAALYSRKARAHERWQSYEQVLYIQSKEKILTESRKDWQTLVSVYNVFTRTKPNAVDPSCHCETTLMPLMQNIMLNILSIKSVSPLNIYEWRINYKKILSFHYSSSPLFFYTTG